MTGDGRQVPAAQVNPAAYPHEQLKQWTDDADTGSAQAFAEAWTTMGDALTEAADTLRRAGADSESGWSGAAAEAMRARLGEIAEWSGSTGALIATAGRSVAREGEAAEAARRAMPEPVPYDPAQLIREAGAGGLLAFAALPQRLYDQKLRHDAAHEDAVRVVTERDDTMSSAAAEVVVFPPPPLLGGPERPAAEPDAAPAGRPFPFDRTDRGFEPVPIPRQFPVLREPGADGIFGSEEPTARSVIGVPDEE